MRFFSIVIFLLPIYSSICFAENLTVKDCLQILRDKIETRLRRKIPWYEDEKFLIPLKGYRIPGAIVIDGEAKAKHNTYLTADFFEKAQIPIPNGAEEVHLNAYWYYPPGLKRKSGVSGSGRDVLYQGQKSRKGGGTNSEIRRSSEFEITWYDRNGLLPLEATYRESGSSIIEYIVAKNFSDMKIPIIPHKAFLLLPPNLFPESLKGNFGLLPTQIERDLTSPRLSMSKKTEFLPNPMRLPAALYFRNATQLSYNFENLAADGSIVDVGHTSPGYPILSAVHRCTTCLGNVGSTADGFVSGALDLHFKRSWLRILMFPREFYRDTRNWDLSLTRAYATGLRMPFSRFIQTKSYTHKLTRTQRRKFLEQVFYNLDEKIWDIPMTGAEKEAFDLLLREKISVEWETLDEENGLDRFTRIFQAGRKLLGLESADIDPKKLYKLRPHRISIGLRFILQVCALESLLGSKEFYQMKAQIMTWLKPEAIEPAEKLFGLFSRTLKSKSLSNALLREKLFREWLPAYEIQANTSSVLEKLKAENKINEVADAMKEIVRKFREPVNIDPEFFVQTILETK